jgi:hypothetical protein
VPEAVDRVTHGQHDMQWVQRVGDGLPVERPARADQLQDQQDSTVSEVGGNSVP